MAKERKTARVLEELVFDEAREAPECEGMTGVTIRPIADRRVDFNWEVSFAHNSTPMCEGTIATIVARAGRPSPQGTGQGAAARANERWDREMFLKGDNARGTPATLQS